MIVCMSVLDWPQSTTCCILRHPTWPKSKFVCFPVTAATNGKSVCLWVSCFRDLHNDFSE